MVFSSIRRRLSTTPTSTRSSKTSKSSKNKKPDPVSGERLILIYGNCQAQFLGAVLAAQGEGLVCVVGEPFGFYPECRGVRPYFATEAQALRIVRKARAARRPVVILEQTAPIADGLGLAIRRLADQVIRFPHLELRSYWHPWLTKVGDGFAPDRIRRQFAFDLAAIRRSETRAGWNSRLSDFIETRHSERLLFHTINHPGGTLMALLHQRICRRLAVRTGLQDESAVERARRDIIGQDGLHFIMEHPLHDAVINALDLNWARDGWYANWQKGYFAAGAGHHRKAASLFEDALSDPTHDPHVQYSYGQLLESRGDISGASRAFGKAHRAYPQNPEYARRWLACFTPAGADAHPLASSLISTFPGA